MNDKYVQEIVNHLIHQIGDDKLLYQLFKGHFLFGKIPGDKDECRHVKRKNPPFQELENRMIVCTWLDKMTCNYQDN